MIKIICILYEFYLSNKTRLLHFQDKIRAINDIHYMLRDHVTTLNNVFLNQKFPVHREAITRVQFRIKKTEVRCLNRVYTCV